MQDFKISITCEKCGSSDVEVELHMIQATGLLGLTCENCGNTTRLLYDTDDLQEIVDRNK